MIDVLVDAGFKVSQCCRVLGVTGAGYCRYRNRPLAPTKMRREWMTVHIREVHTQSRGTYGSRRVHAELTKGHGVFVSERLVAVLMHNAEISGLPSISKAKSRRIKVVSPPGDLVNRQFARVDLNELWVTDITEHPTRESNA